MNPDLNGDGRIDVSDTTLVLVFSTKYGAGKVSSFEEFMEKRQAN